MIDDSVAGLGAPESLEQLLKHEPGREDAVTAIEGVA